MDTQTAEYKEVTLLSAQGEIVRVLVEILGEVALVCRREEYETAKSAGREPLCVGFKRKDILTPGY